MDKKYNFSRGRYWARFHLPNLIYVLLLLFSVLIGYWWIKHDAKKNQNTVFKQPDLVDVFTQDATISRANQSGAVTFEVTTGAAAHFGNQNGVLQNITLLATPQGQPPITTVANQGTWSNDSYIVQLKGNVKMTRAATEDAEALELNTDELQINLYDGLAITDKPFKLLQGKSEMTGTGFLYDYELRNLKVNPQTNNRVHAILYGQAVKE